MRCDAELGQRDEEAVRVLQLPQAILGAHARMQRPVHDRRQPAHSDHETLHADPAEDLPLGGAGRQLDRDRHLGQLLRPAITLADSAVLDDLDALRLLRLVRAPPLQLLGQPELRRHDVVRLPRGVIISHLWHTQPRAAWTCAGRAPTHTQAPTHAAEDYGCIIRGRATSRVQMASRAHLGVVAHLDDPRLLGGEHLASRRRLSVGRTVHVKVRQGVLTRGAACAGSCMCAFQVVGEERTSSRCFRSASLSTCRSAMPSPAFLACAIAAASLRTRDGTESPASISRERESCVSPPTVHSCCSSYTAVSSILG